MKEYPISSNKIIIGHADTYLDQDYHRELLDAGCYIQFDTIGRNHMNSDVDRINSILNLVALGYQDQILLSTDRCFRSDLKTFGGFGYDYLFITFKELITNAGLPGEIFENFTKRNAVTALSW